MNAIKSMHNSNSCDELDASLCDDKETCTGSMLCHPFMEVNYPMYYITLKFGWLIFHHYPLQLTSSPLFSSTYTSIALGIKGHRHLYDDSAAARPTLHVIAY